MKRLLLILLIATLILSAVTVSAGGCDPAVYDCDTDAGFDITVRYPLSIMSNDFAETTIENFVNETTTSFLAAYLGTDLPDFVAATWFLDISSDEYWFSNNIVSVVLTVSDYTGGAHPNSYYQTFTFDLTTSTLLTINDLFTAADPLPTLYPLVQADLIAQLGADMSDFIEDGIDPTEPANYQNFAIASDELIILFSPYQVAPYAAGPREVHIPLAALAGILAPPFA